MNRIDLIKVNTTCVCCSYFNPNMGKWQAFKCACKNSCAGLIWSEGLKKLHYESANPDNLNQHQLKKQRGKRRNENIRRPKKSSARNKC